MVDQQLQLVKELTISRDVRPVSIFSQRDSVSRLFQGKTMVNGAFLSTNVFNTIF